MGRVYVLVVVGDLNKYLTVIPVPDKRDETVARALVEQIILLQDFSKRIHRDKGREFVNAVLGEPCDVFQLERSTSAGY